MCRHTLHFVWSNALAYTSFVWSNVSAYTSLVWSNASAHTAGTSTRPAQRLLTKHVQAPNKCTCNITPTHARLNMYANTRSSQHAVLIPVPSYSCHSPSPPCGWWTARSAWSLYSQQPSHNQSYNYQLFVTTSNCLLIKCIITHCTYIYIFWEREGERSILFCFGKINT